MSARDRSLRPVESLPPTLLPNAVLLAAPAPDRVKSLMLACAVYCALGAVVLSGAHRMAGTAQPAFTFVPDPEARVEIPTPREKALPPPPAGGAARPPAGFVAVEPPKDSNVMPVVVPDHASFKDRSLEVAVAPGGLDGPGVEGVLPAPAPIAPVRSSVPMVIESEQIRVLQQVQPVYPPLARLIKAQGAVVLNLTIDAGGVPTEVTAISGPHPLLINEAIRVARLWRFQPATVDGAAVPATFRLTVAFRLER